LKEKEKTVGAGEVVIPCDPRILLSRAERGRQVLNGHLHVPKSKMGGSGGKGVGTLYMKKP